MQNINIQYLSKIISNLSGIPVRIYNNKKLTNFYSSINFIKDPILLDIEEINKIDNHVSYYVTKYFMYYGIVNYDKYSFIMGPTNQMNLADNQYDELAFLNDIDIKDRNKYINDLKSINKMPLETIMQILCTINYLLNDEELSIKDIVIHDENKYIFPQEESNPNALNTYQLEEKMLMLVKKGDIKELEKLFSNIGAIQGGKLAANQIRQIKNTFIVSTTLVSRAAIDGGLAIKDTLSLSDNFIQKCEIMNSIEDIINLQYYMVKEFTNQVASINYFSNDSKIVKDVINYIKHNISKNITVEDIANNLYLSRPYLSRKFKNDSGIPLSDFIWLCKIEEAKTLLAYTNKSLTAISEYLSFANPSHFTKIFKKVTNMTPIQYRKEHIH